MGFRKESAGVLYADLPNGCIRLLQLSRSYASRSLTSDRKSVPAGISRWPEKLSGTLVQVHLDESPKFTALSYTWGKVDGTGKSVLLNGNEVHIRSNLWDFLMHARELQDRDWAEYLWVDAICINQSDNAERTSQVLLMSRIYRTAERVRIWLGLQENNSGEAMRLLAQPGVRWNQKRSIQKILPTSMGVDICQLCERPYWTRLWIFQELMLARKVELQCGRSVIPFGRFRDFILGVRDHTPAHHRDLLQYRLVHGGSTFAIIEQTARLRQNTLWELMHATRDLQCTEVRDKVFGLLGVAASGAHHVSPDYNMTISTVLNCVLKSQHKVERPRTIQEVADQCTQLTSLIGLNPESIFSLEGFSTPADDLSKYPLEVPGTSISLWWASVYEHTAVKNLLIEEEILPAEDSGRSEEREWYKSEHAVRLLLNFGKVNMDRQLPGGQTPHRAAAESGLRDVVELLLQCPGVDCNSRDVHGRTALHCATSSGKESVVKLLLDDARVEVGLKDDQDQTPLELAVSAGHQRIIEAFRESERLRNSS